MALRYLKKKEGKHTRMDPKTFTLPFDPPLLLSPCRRHHPWLARKGAGTGHKRILRHPLSTPRSRICTNALHLPGAFLSLHPCWEKKIPRRIYVCIDGMRVYLLDKAHRKRGQRGKKGRIKERTYRTKMVCQSEPLKEIM